MYPSEPTQTEIFNDIIKNNNKPETLEEMIIRYIKAHQKKIPNFEIGQKYYDQEPDIIRDPPSRDATGKVDPLKPDERLITNFHANLVDQKVSYLVGKPIEFKYTDNNVIEQINLALGSRFDDKLHSVLTHASNKGIEWIHPYIDEEGELKFLECQLSKQYRYGKIESTKNSKHLYAFIR